MNTIDKVLSFLIIFGFIILTFAHALYLLLQSTSEISQTSNNDSNANMFNNFGSATLAAFFMIITGDLTPVSLWISNNDTILMLLIILFSFFILIYLMNLFIGILSNLINDTNSHASYLALKREILREIELFYLLPHQRRKNNWFPNIFFYQLLNLMTIKNFIN
ncbi:hypothetical protein C2G38_1396557 [Gigaspora rosea]|uniref:Ion transport domain-containing protein n=1 Tax=Gigaspora rosea TaxID=44941 RepID=A0A397W1T5_9GLOM|nr:hypothetical protein C2G38_1396557 [Gigaspora rosea]